MPGSDEAPTRARPLKLAALPGVLATVSLVITRINTIMNFFTARTLASREGSWLITDTIRQADGGQFNDLAIPFRVFVQQKGESFTAAGEKVAVNGEKVRAGRRSKLEAAGSIGGSRVSATFVETPPEGAGARQTRGSFQGTAAEQGLSAMAGKPRTIDEYFATLAAGQRAALEQIRRSIRAAAPRAVECITYSLPAFRLDGKILVAFGARVGHCAFYPMSGFTVEDLKEELRKYDTSKGTIRFPADAPLPAALVRKLVKARIAENAAKSAGRRKSSV